jgi:hypothetical protein
LEVAEGFAKPHQRFFERRTDKLISQLAQSECPIRWLFGGWI